MIQNDLSLSTLVISSVSTIVIALVGWGLKESIKTLISTLLKTMAQVSVLDAKLVEVIKAQNEFPKMKQDLNAYFERLKKIESDLNPK